MNEPELPEDQSPAFQYDLWKIRVENPKKNTDPIEGFETRFQLISGRLGCALTWSKEKLPVKW